MSFGLYSPDMDQGFPGNLTVQVTYTLTEDNEIQIHYEGTADQDTIVNMTNHSYFNLAGHDGGREALLDHKVQILAPEYTPVSDSEAIPTGEIVPVAGTPMDFQELKKIGQDLESDQEKANAFIAEIRAMNRRMGIPDKLEGIKEDDIDMLTKRAAKEANPLYPVPRIMKKAQLKEIYYQIRA